MKDNNNRDNNTICPELGQSVIELPNNLRLRILRNQEISGKCQILIAYCLMLSPPPEMKILSVLVKIFWKTEIELFPSCAISYEN